MREFKRTPGTRNFSFSANKKLSDKIITIANDRYRSFASTIRMLLWIGIEQHEINEKSGNTTASKRQQDAALRKAQAEARAVQREARKQGKVTDVTYSPMPILWGSEEHKKLFGEE